jgi:hypothetical protein
MLCDRHRSGRNISRAQLTAYSQGAFSDDEQPTNSPIHGIAVPVHGTVQINSSPESTNALSAAAKRHRVDVGKVRNDVEADFAARQAKARSKEKESCDREDEQSGLVLMVCFGRPAFGWTPFCLPPHSDMDSAGL